MAEAPLSALCSICYTDPPKYRCPRCPGPVRTCSLPCYKRHQQRASCNGQRDPAAYVKKSQLLTPAGIDHDYNFLTKIEHVIGHADDDQDDQHGSHSRTKRAWRYADSAVGKYLGSHNIVVDKAPMGMSRQKANKTRYIPKSKKILWTVEWVDTDGERRLDEVDGNLRLKDAYAAMLAARDSKSKKRKRTPELNDMPVSEIRTVKEGQESISDPTLAKEEQGEQVQMKPESEAHKEKETSTNELLTRENKVEETKVQMPVNHEDQKSPSPAVPQDPNTLATSDDADDKRILILQRLQQEKDRQAALRSSESTSPPSTRLTMFYLHKPHTTTKSKVLVPMSDCGTLTFNLTNETVLEFPTIYVTHRDIDVVPVDGCMSLYAYEKEKKLEAAELESLLEAAPSATRRALLDNGRGLFGEEPESRGLAGDGASQRLDEKAILDMLRRDVA